MAKNLSKIRLCLVTDRPAVGGLGSRSLFDVVQSAIRGGVDMVQLREKNLGMREWLDLATELARLCRKRKVYFIVNDRADIACASGADGVHLGQDDFPVKAARKILGRNKIIGKSTHSLQEARKSAIEDVDYIAVGPIFWTTTKKIEPAAGGVGPELIAQVRKFVKKPILGIGGIKPENAGLVRAAGATGVAVVSALMTAPDIVEAAKQFRKALD